MVNISEEESKLEVDYSGDKIWNVYLCCTTSFYLNIWQWRYFCNDTSLMSPTSLISMTRKVVCLKFLSELIHNKILVWYMNMFIHKYLFLGITWFLWITCSYLTIFGYKIFHSLSRFLNILALVSTDLNIIWFKPKSIFH